MIVAACPVVSVNARRVIIASASGCRGGAVAARRCLHVPHHPADSTIELAPDLRRTAAREAFGTANIKRKYHSTLSNHRFFCDNRTYHDYDGADIDAAT